MITISEKVQQLNFNNKFSGSKKQIIINNILQRCKSIHQNASQIEIIAKHIEKNAYSSVPVMHKTYTDYFNLVDLADRYWNNVEQKHQNHNWKSKMILTIIRYQVINMWVYCCHFKYEDWKDFRTNFGIFLQKYQN
jgi:hypothetical protein